MRRYNPPKGQFLVTRSSLDTGMSLWQHQRRKQGSISHAALLGPLGAEQVPQHPLMETSGLGSASCPMRCWWHPAQGPGCYL